MPEKNIVHRGRLFPEIQWSSDKIAKSKAENDAIYQHCKIIFEALKAKLIKTHYNYFIAIASNSEEYCIDKDQEIATQLLRSKNLDALPVLFKINDTGACGTI